MRGWGEWVDRHATLFGLAGDRQEGMLRSWAGMFADEGFGPEEAFAATEALARDPPKFRDESLARMWSHLRDARLSAGRVKGPPEGYACELCRGSGRVSVPNPDCLRRWYATRRCWSWLAVLCHCAVGQWWQRTQGKRPQLTLGEYERECPDWRETAAEHDRHTRQALEVLHETRAVDRERGPIPEAIRQVLRRAAGAR